MKKFLLFAMAFMTLAGCSEKEVEEQKPDKISVVPEQKSFSSNGGTVEIQVSSSGEWTVDGSYEWIEVSALAGKDGDKVRFDVAANDEDVAKTAEYVFKTGAASAKFTITCDKAEPAPADELSLFPESLSFASDGGRQSTMVTSSGDWTLSPREDYDWVYASKESGKDGDQVDFIVSPNSGTESRTAVFTFTCGTAEVDIDITSEGLSYFLELASESDIEYPQTGGEMEILLNTNIDYRDIQYGIQQEGNWISFVTALKGESENTAKLIFNIAENETFENRSAVVTIEGLAGLSAEVTVEQAQKDRIEVAESIYYVALDGADIQVPVVSNVDYEVSVSDSWIEYKGKTDDKENFTIAQASSNRTGTITFKGGSVEVKVTVEQKRQALVESVADMSDNWAWPAWNNGSVVDNLTELTMEATVNFQDFKTQKEITTIMGIEDTFLLRLGDGENVNNKTLQLVYKGGKAQAQYELVPYQMLNKWAHIAVVFKSGKAYVYINGFEYLFAVTGMSSVSLGADHNSGTGTPWKPWSFYVGYSYAQGREFKGYMTEVRIWNKALSVAEIKAENHQYYVDPASDGLVAYWKFNESEGATTIKDYSQYGNDLELHAPLKTVKVSLP